MGHRSALSQTEADGEDFARDISWSPTGKEWVTDLLCVRLKQMERTLPETSEGVLQARNGSQIRSKSD